MYITREDMLEVIARMQDLESKLGRLFSNHNYNLRENLGRRNQLLSAVQEKETARVLRKKYNEVLVALDRDATAKSFDIASKLCYTIPSKVVMLDDDLNFVYTKIVHI